MSKFKDCLIHAKNKVWSIALVYLKNSYVPELNKKDPKLTRILKIAVYIAIAIALFFSVIGFLYITYALWLFASYPMPILDNNYALENMISGLIIACFGLASWGFQYVINYYRSRWHDPFSSDIIDEQHYMKFHGWSHIIFALMMIIGVSLTSVNLLAYPNMDDFPKNLDNLKLSIVVLVLIYGVCRIQAHRFKEFIDDWNGSKK